MPPKTIAQKLRENLAYLRSSGASREEIQAEIDRAKSAYDAQSAEERKLSGVEKVGAAASKFASGATFGLLDEAAGLFSDDTKNEQRFLQEQFSEEHPVASFASELAGAVAVPVPFLKAAPKAASKLVRGGRVLLEGALQGGASGLGNAEGSLEERLGSTAKGATAGSVASGVIGGATRSASRMIGRTGEALGLTTPKLDDLVAKIPDEDITKARSRLSELKGRNLAHETTVADVLPQGEGALRQAATSNRAVRKNVDSELRQRSNRLANEADDRFSQHTGTARESGEKARAQRLKKAQDEAGPVYDEAREEAGRYDLVSAEPDFVTPVVLSRPHVKRAIRHVIADDPERFSGNVLADPKLSHDLFDQAYKDMGEDIRYIQSKVRVKTASASERRVVKRMIRDRDALREAMKVRSPSYPKALDKYAGEIAHRDAYDLGAQKAPADIIPEQMGALEPATVPDFKAAKAETLRQDTPNIDIGEMARFKDVLGPIATREKAAVFKATYGDAAYREYVKDLLAMAGLQRMKGGAGESTTVDKLMEQVEADPERIIGVVRSIMSGNPLAAIQAMSPTNIFGKGIDRLRNSKVAQTNADFLMRRGEPDVTRSLDEIVGMREAAQRPHPRDFRRPRPRDAAARVVGGYTGRS